MISACSILYGDARQDRVENANGKGPTREAWKTLALEALPLLNDRSMKRLDGSTPNDVQAP